MEALTVTCRPLTCTPGLAAHKAAKPHNCRWWEVWTADGKCISRVPECTFLFLHNRRRAKLSEPERLILQEIERLGPIRG